MVPHYRYNDITNYIDKVIIEGYFIEAHRNDKGRIVDSVKRPYNYEIFEDVAHMVENVTSKAIRLYLNVSHPDKLATIMERVITKYFNPKYNPNEDDKKTEKKSIFSWRR